MADYKVSARRAPSRGLGDSIERVTEATGIKKIVTGKPKSNTSIHRMFFCYRTNPTKAIAAD